METVTSKDRRASDVWDIDVVQDSDVTEGGGNDDGEEGLLLVGLDLKTGLQDVFRDVTHEHLGDEVTVGLVNLIEGRGLAGEIVMNEFRVVEMESEEVPVRNTEEKGWGGISGKELLERQERSGRTEREGLEDVGVEVMGRGTLDPALREETVLRSSCEGFEFL